MSYYPRLTDEIVKELEVNINSNKTEYTNTSSFVLEKYNIPDLQGYDFDLLIDDGIRPAEEDLENVKKIYGTLSDMGMMDACSKEVWILLTHTVCWEYMQHRWPADEVNIKDRYFFGSHWMSRNGIARLWWMGKLTYKAGADNPWEYTEKMLRYPDSDFSRMILESSTQNSNTRAVYSIIEKFWELRNKGVPTRNMFRFYFKKYNMFGGIKAWSSLSDKDIGKQTDDYFGDFLKNKGKKKDIGSNKVG